MNPENPLLLSFIASVAISIAAAPIGRFLILRRMSLVGDAIGHSLLPGAVLGALLSHSQSWAISIGAAISGSLLFALASRLPRILRLKEDTVFAMFYLAALSFGVLIASSSGGEIHIEEMLFGDTKKTDWFVTGFSIFVAIVSITIMSRIYQALLLDTTEPENRIYEKRIGFARMAFYALVTILIVGSFQTMGALLSIGIILLPAISSGYFSGDLKKQIFLSGVIGFIAISIGTISNYWLGLHQSATSVLLLVAFTLFSAFLTARV